VGLLQPAYVYADPGYRPPIAESYKLVHCYAYQSCEDPEWQSSEAFSVCEVIEQRMQRRIHGYDAAPWGWDEDTLDAAVRSAEAREVRRQASALGREAVGMTARVPLKSLPIGALYRARHDGPLLEVLSHGPEKSYVRVLGTYDMVGLSSTSESDQ
jgi:hypothetical protein